MRRKQWVIKVNNEVVTTQVNFDRAMRFLIDSNIPVDTIYVDDDDHEIFVTTCIEAG